MNPDSKIFVPDYGQRGEDNPTEPKAQWNEKKDDEKHSMWSLDYYRRFFEVTTDQVLSRLVWSMFPKPGINYFQDFIKSNPDLYGPIWISLTLIFTVTMSGNLASYFRLAASDDPEFSWKYDFHVISLAATSILSYCWILPSVLWAFAKWNSAQIGVSYLELTCTYGYCMTIYIPISILWVIQIKWLQWSLACMGTVLSGTVLLKSILPLMGAKKYVIIFAVFCCNFLLSLSLLWNCFQSSQFQTTTNVHIQRNDTTLFG